MPRIQTRPWNPAEHLETAEDVATDLEAAFEDGDPARIATALGDVARAKGMTRVARRAGLSRESRYKGLSSAGNAELATVHQVLRALDLRLQAVPVER